MTALEAASAYLPYLWIAAISLIAGFVTGYDKIAASRLPRHRVPEKILFLLAVLGGAMAMYAVMLLIRHKTQHKRFMLGLPAIMTVQLVLLLILVLVRK